MSFWSETLKTQKNGTTPTSTPTTESTSTKSGGKSSSKKKKNTSFWGGVFDDFNSGKTSAATPPPAATPPVAPVNPLSDTVQRLMEQRDAIANKDFTGDPLSQRGQQESIAYWDKLIAQQTLKDKGGADPITGTMLTPIGNQSGTPLSVYSPAAANYDMPWLDVKYPAPADVGYAKADNEALATKAGEKAKRQVEPKTVIDTRNQIADTYNQINDLDTRIAMLAQTGVDTSKLEEQRQALINKRDMLNGDLNRYNSMLQPEFDRISDDIADISKKLMDFKGSNDEKWALSDQRDALLAQQAELMDALGIENRPIVEWDGRQDLIDEFKKLSMMDYRNPAQNARYWELKEQLERGDTASGNGVRSYSFGDRTSNIVEGTAKNIASNLVNTGGTMMATGMPDLTLGEQIAVARGIRNEADILEEKANKAQAVSESMWETADKLGGDASESLERAKRDLGKVGKAGVDIAENILEMGFDAGVGALTGGGSLPSMFLRVFGGAAQEARQSGASLDQQLAYGLTKAGIEVATEKMFDGVAKIYGGGAADEVTEELIRKLADSDTGRTFLRLVIEGSGEGIEEVVSDLLSPLADSIYKDESVGELYKQLDPADMLYSYIIGTTVGLLGGFTNIATGGNAQSNYELALADAGVGTENQTRNAWEALTGENRRVNLSPNGEEVTAAERVNARERAARTRLGLDAETGQPIVTEKATETKSEAPAETKAETPTETPAEKPVAKPSNPAADALVDALQNKRNENGKVTNKAAEAILGDPELKAEFEKATGEEIKGSKSEQREQIKNNADKVISLLTGETETETEAPATEAPAAEAPDLTPAEKIANASNPNPVPSETVSNPTGDTTIPPTAEAPTVSVSPQEEITKTESETPSTEAPATQEEERQYTPAQQKLGDYLGMGESITDEEIDTILNDRSLRNAMKSFGFTFDSDMTPDETRQAVRAFAQDMVQDGFPSAKAVAKVEQDRTIQSREQELQYQIDKLTEDIEAAKQQGDIEKRKALEKQKQRLVNKTKRGKALKRITDKANDLTKTLTKAKASKYVPTEFVTATTDFIEALNEARVDRTSDTKTAQRAAAKFDRIAEEFSRLKEAQVRLENNKGIAIGLGFDEDVEAAMKECQSRLAETPINEMSVEDLEDIANTLTAMQKAISRARNIELGNKKASAVEHMMDLTRETREEAGKGDSLGSKYIDTMSRPETFFNKLAGWAKNSGWHKMYELLNNGQKKAMDLKLQAQDMFSDLIKETKNYKSLRNEVRLNGLTDADGNVVPISRGMMLSLYMHLMNEQNANHIAGGGITTADIADYYKNRHDKGFGTGRNRAIGMSEELSDLNYQYKLAKAEGDTAKMESLQEKMDNVRTAEAERLENLRIEIQDQLTDYERRFIAKTQSFFSWAQDNLNATTEDVYGFLKATVENYFPIDSDPYYRRAGGDSTETETARQNKSLESSRIVQQRTNANNPIMLMDISDVLNDYINTMAQYCGVMPAVKTFNQIYKSQLAGHKANLRETMAAKFGKGADQYINNLLDDLQGSRKTSGGLLGSLLSTTRGNFAASVLTLNARVALSQRASYFNAASVLGWRNLAAGLAKPKADLSLIRQYSPLLQARTSGSDTAKFSDNRTDLQSQRDRITRKFGFMLNWINDADNDTVRALWNAAEAKVQNETDLAEGTDDYYKEVGRLFDEAVERTQPGYEVMQRPDLLRNPDSLTRTLTMFMTQRLQNFNEVYDRIAQAKKFSEDLRDGKNGVTKADVTEANRAATNAVSGVITSSLALTIMKAGVDALLHRTKNYRDKDTGELTAESALLRIMDYTAESLASNVWLGAEAYQLSKVAINGQRYYGTSVPGVDTISNAVEDIINAFRASDEKRPDAVLKAAGSVATMFGGIPFDNAKGYVDAVLNWAKDYENQTFLESDATYTTKQNKEIVYDALTGGDDNRLFKVGDRVGQAMERMGDRAEQNVKEVIRDHYKAGDIDSVDAASALADAGIDDGMDTVRKWQKTIKYDKYIEENPQSTLSESEYTRYLDNGSKVDVGTYEEAAHGLTDAFGKSSGIKMRDAAEWLLDNGYDEDTAGAIFDIVTDGSSTYKEMLDNSGDKGLAPLSDIAKSGMKAEDYNALYESVVDAKSGAENIHDSKGNREAAQIVKDADIPDEQKDVLISAVSKEYKADYDVARDYGYGANEAIDLLLDIDSMKAGNSKPNNGSLSQGEFKEFYKAHPEYEPIIELMWNERGYKNGSEKGLWKNNKPKLD